MSVTITITDDEGNEVNCLMRQDEGDWLDNGEEPIADLDAAMAAVRDAVVTTIANEGTAKAQGGQ